MARSGGAAARRPPPALGSLAGGELRSDLDRRPVLDGEPARPRPPSAVLRGVPRGGASHLPLPPGPLHTRFRVVRSGTRRPAPPRRTAPRPAERHRRAGDGHQPDRGDHLRPSGAGHLRGRPRRCRMDDRPSHRPARRRLPRPGRTGPGLVGGPAWDRGLPHLARVCDADRRQRALLGMVGDHLPPVPARLHLHQPLPDDSSRWRFPPHLGRRVPGTLRPSGDRRVRGVDDRRPAVGHGVRHGRGSGRLPASTPGQGPDRYFDRRDRNHPAGAPGNQTEGPVPAAGAEDARLASGLPFRERSDDQNGKYLIGNPVRSVMQFGEVR